MEIEIIIKKTLIFAGLFTVLYTVIATFTFLGQVVFEQVTGGNRWVSLAPSIVVIVLILRPLENFLTRVTDRFLFQKRYDYRELLRTFTTEVLTVLDINRLTRLTTYKLADIVKIDSCGILLLNEEEDRYILAASYGIKAKEIYLTRDNTLAAFMERTRMYLSVKQHDKSAVLPESIMQDMNKLKVEFAIPLILHNRMIGILTLGKKKSDEDYSQDDIAILLPLARTLAIAIGNAELFDELSKTQAEAAQREKMAVIGTLSAGINHEICNPLGIVRGQCEAFILNLKDGLYKNKTEKELLDKATDIMQKTIKEVDRATAVTKRLSSFAKPIREARLDEVNLNDELDEVLALVGHELRLEKIDVIKEISPDVPDIIADHKQIQEIFFNLIRNAGQAIGERGRIIIRARANGANKILIEIEDTGHGIPEDKLDQIFHPFYTTKEPGQGTGLGLFIVRQVIEKNKGKISVKSKIGAGTTFILEFPAAVKVRA
jgi:signal transduction histidine kinase